MLFFRLVSNPSTCTQMVTVKISERSEEIDLLGMTSVKGGGHRKMVVPLGWRAPSCLSPGAGALSKVIDIPNKYLLYKVYMGLTSKGPPIPKSLHHFPCDNNKLLLKHVMFPKVTCTILCC